MTTVTTTTSSLLELLSLYLCIISTVLGGTCQWGASSYGPLAIDTCSLEIFFGFGESTTDRCDNNESNPITTIFEGNDECNGKQAFTVSSAVTSDGDCTNLSNNCQIYELKIELFTDGECEGNPDGIQIFYLTDYGNNKCGIVKNHSYFYKLDEKSVTLIKYLNSNDCTYNNNNIKDMNDENVVITEYIPGCHSEDDAFSTRVTLNVVDDA